MTKFEQVGVGFQLEAETPDEAARSFNYSCRVCCTRGIRLNCDRCAISTTHQQVLGMFRDVEDAKRRKQEAEVRRAGEVSDLIRICVGT